MGKDFPDLKYKDIAKISKNLGFVNIRNAGSHEIWYSEIENKYVTIPNHGAKSLKRKTIKSIFEDIGITIKNFKDF